MPIPVFKYFFQFYFKILAGPGDVSRTRDSDATQDDKVRVIIFMWRIPPSQHNPNQKHCKQHKFFGDNQK